MHKSMRSDRIHPQVLKKLSIIPDKSWLLREVSEDWRKTNGTHIFRKRKIKDSGNHGVNQPHLNYWEGDRGANSGILFQVLKKLCWAAASSSSSSAMSLNAQSPVWCHMSPCSLLCKVLAPVHSCLRFQHFLLSRAQPAAHTAACTPSYLYEIHPATKAHEKQENHQE